ncbi:Uu.00g034940.m01.CDS01 [Anthostomella pinea]|uniref:Uu.00g034940.m01.CDS01 n=1 Tax=Anthostomella pinea TaxID=933095 RepID=A0AAI8YDB6_9PEZI|nr:Uu.00g034940.m01.CDS01 [Anthostomella pinea]
MPPSAVLPRARPPRVVPPQGKTSQSWTNSTSAITNSHAGDLVGDVDGVASGVIHNLTQGLTTVLNPERKPAGVHAAINAWLEGKGRRPNSFLNGTIFPVLDGLDCAKATAPKKKCGSRKRV